jgi:para-nitrobenzyl esterase
MRRRWLWVLGSLAVGAFGLVGCRPVSAPPAAAGEQNVMAKIDNGEVAGVAGDGVQAFLGIPYAAPPVGKLRWRAPQPVTPWEGARQATMYESDCTQAPNDIEKIRTTPSEDCLYLNVWRPSTGEKLPVLVWIHGGGFVGGGSSIPWYDGSAFARDGIVVVSLNYRLGRLGFFAHPALLATGERPTGNFGFLDQIAALAWVQRNIAAFGGDPARVTIMGQSAGGASVLALLTSPITHGLFEQAVVLSGGGRDGLLSKPMTGGTERQPSADQIDKAFAEQLGIRGESAEVLAALRALPAATVQGDLNLNKLAQVALLGDQVYPGTQMVDGDIVTGQPDDILAGGKAPAIPMIIGTTALDLPAFFPPSKLNPLAFFGEDAEKARAAYGAPAQLDQKSLAALLLGIGADMTMHEPARFVAQQVTAHGSPAWLYRFTYTAETTRPQSMAQGHAGELAFLFDQLAAQYGSAVTPKDEETAHAFHTYVANFVKQGDPNQAGLPQWPTFTPAAYDLMHFTLESGPVYERDPRAERVELVEKARERQ